MESEYGKIEGDFVLDGKLTLFGMATGSVVVAQGGELILHGMIVGSLTVKTGGRAVLNGTVVKGVSNQGGHISLFGTVQGDYVRGPGTNEIDSKAIVVGRTI